MYSTGNESEISTELIPHCLGYIIDTILITPHFSVLYIYVVIFSEEKVTPCTGLCGLVALLLPWRQKNKVL